MKTTMILVLTLFSINALADAHAECVDGAYDLGPSAASMTFRCDDGMTQTLPTAMISFCRRQTLLESGECTGAANPIHCSFETSGSAWVCTESGHYPFRGVITREDGDHIRYRFKSSFNSGDLEGTRISN